MKRLALIVVFAALTVLSSCSKYNREISTLLKELDALVAESRYENARQARIDSLCCLVPYAAGAELPGLYSSIFGLYYGFQSDSALVYVNKAYQAALAVGDAVEEKAAQINRAKIYQMTASFSDALDVLDSLNTRRLPWNQRMDVYSLYNTVYEAMRKISIDPVKKDKYRRLARSYKDSLLMEDDNIFIICDILVSEGKYDQAVSRMKPYCDSLDEWDALCGSAAYSLADMYKYLGEEEEEMEYLALASISDLKRGNREYLALIHLSLNLYEKGDIRRAFSYLNRSLSDATACNAKLRIDELSPLVSMVNSAHIKLVRRDILLMATAVLAIFLTSLVLWYCMVRLARQKRKLAEFNNQLIVARALQEEANRRISEASNVKNTYITRLMLDCIARIERFEKYRKGLNRMAMNGSFDVLGTELKSHSIIEKEWNSFYEMFDTTFLSLFPSFVGEFNNLLLSEHRIKVPASKYLTSELRIFALIRLGIDGTEKIASLLRYSKATVYSYRSRTRLKAKCPDTFEEDVRKILSI